MEQKNNQTDMNISAIYHFPLTQLLRLNFNLRDEATIAAFCFFFAIITLGFLISANFRIFKYRKEKNRYDAMFKDKDRLNTMVVQLMCKILQSDPNEIYKNKIAFIIKYIQQSFTGGQKDDTIEYLLTIYAQTDKESYNTKIRENIHNLLNFKTWMQAYYGGDVSAISDKKKRFSYIATLSNADIKEIAQALEYFLTEDQKKYFSYLLFHMANIGNNINKTESANLRTICVDHFLTPDEFSELKEAFDSQRQGQWYNKNLKEKDPQLYQDSEEIHNIFPQKNTTFGQESNTNYERKITSYLFPLFVHCFLTIIITLITNISIFAKLTEVTVICVLFSIVIRYAWKHIQSYSFSFSCEGYLNSVKEIGCANILYMASILFLFII